jgi:hypothetical protein
VDFAIHIHFEEPKDVVCAIAKFKAKYDNILHILGEDLCFVMDKLPSLSQFFVC